MAKVTGPLFSVSASGSIAKAMTHFPWKGRAVVRKWLKPSNPKTTTQGDIRQTLGGLGRGCSAVHTASQYATDARETAGPGQTWISSLVKYCVDTWMSDAAAFQAKLVEFLSHDIDATCITAATTLGLADFTVEYRGVDGYFINGLMLYMLGAYGCAQYALNHEKFNRDPFKTALAEWVVGDVAKLTALLPSL